MQPRPGLTSPALMLLLLAAPLSHVVGVNNQLRGLAPTTMPLYAPGRDFECLDGSQLLPFERINDDYCDCADGSDEPGTAACTNGSFYCINAGYKSVYIPSSWVNDGVCDCCDGSDEYSGDIQCLNNCNELGREAWLEAQRAVELAKKGYKLRLEYIERGKQLKTENQAKLTKLRLELEEADRLKKEFEILKTSVEEREATALEKYKLLPPRPHQEFQEEENDSAQNEAEAYFKNILDADSSGTVTVAELQTRIIFDKDHNGDVSREEALFFLNNKEELTLHEFVHFAWVNMKPFLMMEKGFFKPAEKEIESKDDLEHFQGIEDEQHDDDEHEDEEREDDEHRGLISGEVTEQQNPLEQEQSQESKKESTPQYDEETQAIIDEATQVREKYREADRAINDLQTEIHKIEERIERDYGLEEEFSPLDGMCYEYQDLEYVYSLCPFGRASQRSKSGGSEINLGIWNDWIGSGPDKYTRAKYDQGLACWNGPARSVIVSFRCAEEDRLLAVSEPNRCEYAMEFSTPVVCKSVATASGEGLNVHDEL